ncbi:hypothetical protein [Saccharopolyspora tripterygii]
MSAPTAQRREQTWPTREDYLADQEHQRAEAVAERRRYYEGIQYDDDNDDCARQLAQADTSGEKSLVRLLFDTFQLPEHLRKHAYSTQLRECVDFIADRLAQGFAVEAEPHEVSEVITACLDATPELSSSDDDEQRSVTTVLREACKTGDVPVLIRWDAADGACWLEFWDSEQVEARFAEGRPDRLEKVIVRQRDWRQVDGETRQVTLRREWTLDGDPGAQQAVERVYVESDDDTTETVVELHEWGVPVLPWWIVRGYTDGLRSTRGTSLISEQAMRTADRYNAVEQVSWLIARYNSHGNLVVTGDAAMVQQDTKPIHKDVADVLTFPGGTSADVITLPTDPAMIEHQRGVLLEALYGSFGLTRVDQETVSNLGAISGYALEILNQRSEVTFSRTRSQLVKDIKALFMRVVDCHQAWSSDDDGDEAPPVEDPTGQRRITVHLGTGYVVDKALIRDDYLAGLISQREALRQRGWTDEQIDDMLNEQAEEQQARTPEVAAETSLFGTSTQAGRLLGDADRVEPARNGGGVR